MLIQRIYLNEILPHIRKTDLRSAFAWCKRNNIQIKQDGSDSYVILEDFEVAYNLPSLINPHNYIKQPSIKRYKAKGGIAKRIINK